MKKFLILVSILSFVHCFSSAYTPSREVVESQKQFSDDRFGIFIHWGIYSMFGQGEWYLNRGINAEEYAKAAKGFYPADFNAEEWVKAIKDSGARYICFTTRHHDGFSMFHTRESDYNIVDATPFKRDVLKEIAEECEKQGIALHLYYSHIDWTRPDYPQGRTGNLTGRDKSEADWDSYYGFMNNQLRELLTEYGPVRAIWFDGWWDHDEDEVPFDWQLEPQYEMIHSLQPGCLIGNNHHQNPFQGEDIQIFERDVPGENTAGYSFQDISKLPLETCNTMNGMWGYKIEDQNYKDEKTLIQYLVKTAGMGANLLLNIGPQPNGELPVEALDRLKKIGNWMKINGETIYGTQGSPFGNVSWGTATTKGDRLFLHVFDPENSMIVLPEGLEISETKEYSSGKKLKTIKMDNNYIIRLGDTPDDIDYIIECKYKPV